MKVKIDINSGFCFGVVFAIERAEKELRENEELYCLGDIVHNSVEVKRLEDKGLKTINREEFKKLKNKRVLIRAHGEPPETYKIAEENNIRLIDATCPVVLKLQEKIKTGFEKINEKDGQLVIFGKKGHAEVIGLMGQTGGKGIVVSEIKDVNNLDFNKPVIIFSQTTKGLKEYDIIKKEIARRFKENNKNPDEYLIANNSICGQVSHRDVQLKEFSIQNDVIVFVSGKKSSNGQMLYQVCKEQNPHTYFVSNVEELKSDWFKDAETVGVCGATSTPAWLMGEIKDEILSLDIKNG